MPAEPIRPALKLFAAFLAGVIGVVLYLLLYPTAAPEPPDRVASGAAADPTGRGGSRGGSARRHWSSSGGWSREAAAAPGWADTDPDRDDTDPQVRAMHRSYGGPDAGIEPDFWPTTRRARLTRVSGDVPVEEGARCEVRVLPVRAYQFNCLIKVACGGVVIYPEPELEAGYVACNLRDGFPTRAVDDGVTGEDGDPTVDFDVLAGSVVVSDARDDGRSFAAELQLDPLLPRLRM